MIEDIDWNDNIVKAIISEEGSKDKKYSITVDCLGKKVIDSSCHEMNDYIYFAKRCLIKNFEAGKRPKIAQVKWY